MSFRGAILLSEDRKMALVVRSVFRHTQPQGDVLMKPEVIKKALKDTIQAMTDCSWFFSARPGKDNTRNRQFPFSKGDFLYPCLWKRNTKPRNYGFLWAWPFCGYFLSIYPTTSCHSPWCVWMPISTLYGKGRWRFKIFCGFRLLAVDGSDLQIAANPGVNGQKDYNLLHINAMYDVQQHIYMDALVQKSRKADESGALTAMVDRSAIANALLLADRV